VGGKVSVGIKVEGRKDSVGPDVVGVVVGDFVGAGVGAAVVEFFPVFLVDFFPSALSFFNRLVPQGWLDSWSVRELLSAGTTTNTKQLLF
jgi:hypothetical protein